MRKVIIGLAAVAAAAFVACVTAPTPVGATQEQTDNTTSPYPQWIQPGEYIGKSSNQAPNSSVSSGNVALQVFGDAGVNGNMVVGGTVSTGGGTNSGNGAVSGTFSANGAVSLGLLPDAGYQVVIAPDGGLTDLVSIAASAVSIGSGLGPSSPATIILDGGVTFQGAVTFPSSSAAGAVSYFAGGQPEVLWGIGGVTFSNATALQGYNIGHNLTFSAITGKLTTASAGTGSVTVTVTDGTNTCTFTGTCAGSLPTTGWAGTATYRFAATNGAGTGCAYTTATPGLTASVTSNCGTTTPIGSINFEGSWQ